MNRTFLLLLWRTRLAWRGLGRGRFVCAIVMLSAAAALFLVRQTPPVVVRAPRIVPAAWSARSAQTAGQSLANLGSAFEPNVGQAPPQVKFLARARAAAVFLTDDSLYVSWAEPARVAGTRPVTKRYSLRFEFVGAGRGTKRTGGRLLPGKTNYLIGRNARNWHTNVPRYAGVQYAHLYPGVDARFYGGAEGLEYDLTVARRVDLRRIELGVSGADALRLDPQGNLVMRVGARELTMKRPSIYQSQGGARHSVTGGYRLLNRDRIGFEVGKHRSDLPLVIDPSISIAYTTFLGGAGAEKGNSVAVDSSGLIYVGGTTTLPSFPQPTTMFAGSTGPGPLDGTSNLFVAKIDPTQTGAASLIYLTFMGGSGNDQGGMVALDNSPASATPPGPPNLAILGWSTSSDFPITVGGAPSGSTNLTVSDLNGAGNGFIYSEYLGGSGLEAVENAGGIATDSLGDVFVTSDTTSGNLPVTSAAIEATFTGPSDGVLAEFAAGTGTVVYCTYFGLNASTVGATGVAVDSLGNAYVAGFTSSTATTFTNTFEGAYPNGSLDGFVMEINPATSGAAGLIYGSFVGGTGSDQVMSIAVDSATPANAYFTGVTESSNLIPSSGVTNLPFQASLAGTQNGFFGVINQSTGPPAVPTLEYLTYLGGSGTDAAQAVAVFSSTQVFVAGSTTSANFPSLCSLQGFSGTQDAFLAQFNPSLGGTSSLLGMTFLGGSFTAEANGVGADPTGNAIIFGDTASPDYPLAAIPNPNTAFQPTCASCGATPPLSDALLTKVNMSAAAQACVELSQSPINVGSFADGTSAPPVSILLTNDGGASLNVSSVTLTGANNTDFSVGNDTCLNASIPPAMPPTPAGTCNFSITFTPSMIGPETAQLQLTDNGVGSPQTVTLNGTGTGAGITLSATSLAFPATAQGRVDPNAMTAILTNASSDSLVIEQSSIEGTNPTDFEFGTSNTCTATSVIMAGGTCTIAVQFTPNEPSPPATGLALSAQAALSILDQINQSTQAVTVSLSGSEIPASPGILFSPTSLSFSGQNVGGATASQPVTVTNNGSAPLAISSVAITGANPGDFSETDNCVASSPLAPAPAPNASCTILVTFKPTATGPRAASVSVADNVNPSPQTVGLTGTGTAAGVTLMPLSLTFAGQNPGTPPSQPQTVTLQNTGTGPLSVSSIAVEGPNSGDFAETSNCPLGPATLPANGACAIAVTFAPTGAGARSASLSISDSAIPSPQIVGLSGTGTVPGAQFNLPAMRFGTGAVGTQVGSENAQLSNTGNGPLTITSVGFAGADPGDFQASGSCVGTGGAALSVGAGSSCAVTVTFVPTAAGSRSALLSVTDNAPNSPQQVSLTGTATDFQLGAVASGATSATVTAGETATFSMQVSSVNGFNGSAVLSATDAIPASKCTVSPQQVTVSGGQSTGFSVTVTTTARSTATSRVRFFVLLPSGRLRTAVGLWLLAFILLALWRRRRGKQRWLRPGFVLAGVLLLVSCGAGGSPSSANGTPAGTYTVTITGTSSGVARTVNLSITVQ